MGYSSVVLCLLAIIATTISSPTPCNPSRPHITPATPCTQPCHRPVKVILLNGIETELPQLIQELSCSHSKDVAVSFYSYNGGANFLGNIVTGYWELLRTLNDHDFFFTIDSDHKFTTVVVTKLCNQHNIDSIISSVRGLSNNVNSASVFYRTSPRFISTSNGGSFGHVNGDGSTNFISGGRSLNFLSGGGSTGYIGGDGSSGFSGIRGLGYIDSGLGYLESRGSASYLNGGVPSNYINGGGSIGYINGRGSSDLSGYPQVGYVGGIGDAGYSGRLGYLGSGPSAFVSDGGCSRHGSSNEVGRLGCLGRGGLSYLEGRGSNGYLSGRYSANFISGGGSSGYIRGGGQSGFGDTNSYFDGSHIAVLTPSPSFPFYDCLKQNSAPTSGCDNFIIVNTNHPGLYLKAFYNTNKVLRQKTSYEVDEVLTLNFIPVVKSNGHNVQHFEDLAKQYVARHFEEPVVLRNPSTDIVLVDHGTNFNSKVVLWPVTCVKSPMNNCLPACKQHIWKLY